MAGMQLAPKLGDLTFSVGTYRMDHNGGKAGGVGLKVLIVVVVWTIGLGAMLYHSGSAGNLRRSLHHRLTNTPKNPSKP